MPTASLRRICRVLGVARATLYRSADEPPAPQEPASAAAAPATPATADLLTALRTLVCAHPTYGYRRLAALLRKQLGRPINRKRVARLMRLHQWQVVPRTATPRPRAQAWASRTRASNERWSIDMTHIPCGRDGWAHLVAIIDCYDRTIVGYELSLRGRAKEAERALEAACLARYGTDRPSGPMPVIRSDNGLIFQSRRFVAACQFYRLEHEYITPYTPEQNGMIERFFRSLKEECVWQSVFPDFATAEQAIAAWIRWYNAERPHQALGYRSPQEYMAEERRAQVVQAA